MIEFLDKMQ